MAPPMTVASLQKATTAVPSTRPVAASMPESSSGVRSSSVPSSNRAVSRWTGLRGSCSRGSLAGFVAVVVMGSSSGFSDAAEGDRDVGAAEAEGVVERDDVAVGQVALRGRDVEVDLGVLVVEVDRRRADAVVER